MTGDRTATNGTDDDRALAASLTTVGYSLWALMAHGPLDQVVPISDFVQGLPPNWNELPPRRPPLSPETQDIEGALDATNPPPAPPADAPVVETTPPAPPAPAPRRRPTPIARPNMSAVETMALLDQLAQLDQLDES